MFPCISLQTGALFKVAVLSSDSPDSGKLVDILFKHISIVSSMLSRSIDKAHFITEDIIGEAGTR